MSAIAACVSCNAASGAPKSLRDCACASDSSKARRAKPIAAAPTVLRKTSSVAIAILNPSPSFADAAPQPERARRRSRSVPSGCGEIVSSSFRHGTAGGRGIHGECAQPLAPVIARAREDDVEIGDAGIGDPRFLAIEHVAVACTTGAASLSPRRRSQPRTPRARRRRYSFAGGDLRGKYCRFSSGAAEQARSGRRPDPASQRRSRPGRSDRRAFARQAERAHVVICATASASLPRRARAPTHENFASACTSSSATFVCAEPALEPGGKRAVLLIEDRRRSSTSSCLRTSRVSWRRRPRKRGESRRSPSTSPALRPRNRWHRAAATTIPHAASVFVIACAKRRAVRDALRELARALCQTASSAHNSL